MSHSELRPENLIIKYLQGTLTLSEEEQLNAWLSEGNNREIFEELTGPELFNEDLKMLYKYDKKYNPEAWADKPAKVVTGINWRAIAAVAGIILVVGILVYAGYILLKDPKSSAPDLTKNDTTKTQLNDVDPGTNNAILTLADGRSFNLDTLKNKKIPARNDLNISVWDSAVSFKDTGSGIGSAFNTLVTPRAAKFAIELPDGSKAWLNAASTIKFPPAFEGEERRIEITGEVFFEVVKIANKPFFVSVLDSNMGKKAEIAVLGTRFNVNAYGDESEVITTVEEGRVKIRNASSSGETKILFARQQAKLDGQHIKVADPDSIKINEALAWQKGEFRFENTPIGIIVPQLAKWYNLDVQWGDSVNRSDSYSGTMARAQSLQTTLKILTEIDKRLQFEVKGNQLIISTAK